VALDHAPVFQDPERALLRAETALGEGDLLAVRAGPVDRPERLVQPVGHPVRVGGPCLGVEEYADADSEPAECDDREAEQEGDADDVGLRAHQAIPSPVNTT
jgi:hypothetical protein